jgi:hypothetical protein
VIAPKALQREHQLSVRSFSWMFHSTRKRSASAPIKILGLSYRGGDTIVRSVLSRVRVDESPVSNRRTSDTTNKVALATLARRDQ